MWIVWLRWYPPVALLFRCLFSRSLCEDILSQSCLCVYMSWVVCMHLLSIGLGMKKVLPGFVPSQRPSHGQWMLYRVVCWIRATSTSVDLWHGCDLSLSTRLWILPVLWVDYRLVFSPVWLLESLWMACRCSIASILAYSSLCLFGCLFWRLSPSLHFSR